MSQAVAREAVKRVAAAADGKGDTIHKSAMLKVGEGLDGFFSNDEAIF